MIAWSSARGRRSSARGELAVRPHAGLVEVTVQNARFAHSRLAAYEVILEALVRGDAIARELPRGYAKLADQLRRALLSALPEHVIALLDRFAAMATGLGQLGSP